jgi:glutathione S-transferase
MYTLYYSPSACSLATQVVLHELDQQVEIVNVSDVENFSAINPVGAVPVLIEQDQSNGQSYTYTEGAAIILHLLDRHQNSLLTAAGVARNKGIEQILFANATMHPAYGRLFFIAQQIEDEAVKDLAFKAAAKMISTLWQVVEQELAKNSEEENFLAGEGVSAADIMLTVYSRWGGSFPVNISIGERSQKMIDAVLAMPSFKRALAAEG